MTMIDLNRYRAEFPITERYAYLSHAATSPLSQRVIDAVHAWMLQSHNESLMQMYMRSQALLRDLRQRIVTLINATHIDEIVLMPNTATGLNTVALSLPLQPGDNVLVLDGDYPANIYPWLNLAYRGVLTKFVPTVNGGLDLNRLEQRIDRRTRVIALSTVMFATGFRNDIAAVGQLCHDRGIYFVVDGIQSVGVLPIDVQACQIDFLAVGAHKWLLSAGGSGFLYCRHERLRELQPGAYVGAPSVINFADFLDYNLTLQDSADRFNVGMPNMLGAVALHAAIGLIQEVGIDQISQHVLDLVHTLIEDLTARGYSLACGGEPAQRSAIVVAQVPDAEMYCKRFEEAGVIVTPRGGGVRVAPHFYNTPEEVLRVGELL